MLGIDIVGVAATLLAVWGLIGVLQSPAATLEKLIWVIILVAIPILGFALWYVMGPGSKKFPPGRA